MVLLHYINIIKIYIQTYTLYILKHCECSSQVPTFEIKRHLDGNLDFIKVLRDSLTWRTRIYKHYCIIVEDCFVGHWSGNHGVKKR